VRYNLPQSKYSRISVADDSTLAAHPFFRLLGATKNRRIDNVLMKHWFLLTQDFGD
jgi:hypothetical protein